MLTVFKAGKYLNWYTNIITNAVKNNRIKRRSHHKLYVYYENHHIIPKSICPELTSIKSNLVLLTGREHFICHWLLTKMCLDISNTYKMYTAFCYISGKKSKTHLDRYSPKSYQYEIAKRKQAIVFSEQKRGTIPWNKGLTKETDDRITLPWNKGLTKETDDRIIATTKGTQRPGIGGAKKGRKPWNKGLTIDDDRVKNNTKKATKTRKESGFYNDCGKYLPKLFGDDNPMKRPEQKQRMSELAKRRFKLVKEDGSWTWGYRPLDNETTPLF